MKELNVGVGIIGTGVGIRTLLPGFMTTGRAAVTAISSSSLDRAEQFARKFDIPIAAKDFRDVCDAREVDLICVASPNVMHFEHASYALATGKPVLVEKPLAMTLQETEDLCHIQRSRTSFAVVDHELRFNPHFAKIRDLIQLGSVGRPYYLRIHQQGTSFSNRDAKWNWSFNSDLGGGVRLAMGSHLVDLARFLLAERTIFGVTGGMDVVVPTRTDETGQVHEVRASSFFSAQLHLARQVVTDLTATAAAVGENRFDIDVLGTEGELHFDLENKLRGAFLSQTRDVSRIDVSGVLPEEAMNQTPIFKGSFTYFAEELVGALLSGDTSRIKDAASFEDALVTQQVLDGLAVAARDMTLVDLNGGYEPGAMV